MSNMTDETRFRLLAAFRTMSQRITMASFDSRLILQKKVYLLQELGLNLGNSYGWYIRGPYSRDVANDGFFLEKVQDQITELDNLSHDETNAVERLQSLINETMRTLRKDEAYCLELLASLHFVLKYGYPKPPTREHAIFQFGIQKPKFRNDAGVAMELLQRYNLA